MINFRIDLVFFHQMMILNLHTIFVLINFIQVSNNLEHKKAFQYIEFFFFDDFIRMSRFQMVNRMIDITKSQKHPKIINDQHMLYISLSKKKDENTI